MCFFEVVIFITPNGEICNLGFNTGLENQFYKTIRQITTFSSRTFVSLFQIIKVEIVFSTTQFATSTEILNVTDALESR